MTFFHCQKVSLKKPKKIYIYLYINTFYVFQPVCDSIIPTEVINVIGIHCILWLLIHFVTILKQECALWELESSVT